MNAVDRNNRDSMGFSTSIRKNRYYIRMFCWVFDRVFHTEYVVVCFLGRKEIGNPKWKKYMNCKSDRHDFHIDLGVSLLNYGIGLEWGGKYESKPPYYMTREAFVPCACNICFRCINSITSSIEHDGQKWKVVIFYYQCGKAFKTEECTEKRVELGIWGDYQKMCYRKQDKSLNNKEKKFFAIRLAWGAHRAWKPYVKNAGILGMTSTKSKNNVIWPITNIHQRPSTT